MILYGKFHPFLDQEHTSIFLVAGVTSMDLNDSLFVSVILAALQADVR
jgi:hypothetical protein